MAAEGVPDALLTQKLGHPVTGSSRRKLATTAFAAATSEALTHWAARTRLCRAIEAYEASAGEITQAEMDAVIAKMGGL
jgi:hypothetical protein